MAGDLIPPPSPAGRPAPDPEQPPAALEPEPEPAPEAAPASPPGPSAFRARFGFLTGVLAGCAVAAAVLLVILLSGDGRSRGGEPAARQHAADEAEAPAERRRAGRPGHGGRPRGLGRRLGQDRRRLLRVGRRPPRGRGRGDQIAGHVASSVTSIAGLRSTAPSSSAVTSSP